MSDDEYADLGERVNSAIKELVEHFDTVYVLVSRYDSELSDTNVWQKRAGCPYSVGAQIIEAADAIKNEGVKIDGFTEPAFVLDEEDDDEDGDVLIE